MNQLINQPFLVPAAVPQSPDVVVDEPRPVPESESEKKETLRYSTEEETDSKQMQQRNDRLDIFYSKIA